MYFRVCQFIFIFPLWFGNFTSGEQSTGLGIAIGRVGCVWSKNPPMMRHATSICIHTYNI
uniref:Uncharacterized protein n=1 Tax=Setaria viridis TaxID=4556 RepID=A0A4U6UJR5_SETVI|nr:hypothetical protein SEVIR_5G254250v2 [Setaria viridis]